MSRLTEPLRNMTVLVTGATGSLGRHLVAELVAGGVEVKVLSRQGAAATGYWPDFEVLVCPGALQDGQSLKAACDGVDCIFHLASYAPDDSDTDPENHPEHAQVTAAGTRLLVQAALKAGVKSIVFASSTRAADGSVSDYAKAKRTAEELLQATDGLKTAILRLAPLYGIPGRGNVAAMARAIQRGRFPPIPDFGDKRSLLHVQDAVQSLILAATSSAVSESIYTVTDLQEYSTRGMYELLMKQSGKVLPRWYVPVWMLQLAAWGGDVLEYASGRSMPMSSRRLKKMSRTAVFDGTLIVRETGFSPKFTLQNSIHGFPELDKTENT